MTSQAKLALNRKPSSLDLFRRLSRRREDRVDRHVDHGVDVDRVVEVAAAEREVQVVGEVDGGLAEQRDLLVRLVATEQEILVGAVRRKPVPVQRVQVRNVPDQVAVLAEVVVLVDVEQARRPVDELAALRDQPEFLRKRAIVVETLGLRDRPRRAAVEGEPAVARVDARVVADAGAGVLVVRGAGRERREAETDLEFERGQLHFTLRGLELHGTELVVAVVAAIDQVFASGHLAAAADFVVLPLVRQLRAEILARFETHCRTGILDVDRVDVLDAAILGQRRQHVAVDHRVAVGIGAIDVRVVDDAVVVDHAGIDTKRDRFGQRDVQQQVGVEVEAVRPFGHAEVDARPALELLGIGPVHDVADVARQRAGAVQRALRPAQHLDPVDVLQHEIAEQRRVVDVGRHGRRRRQRHVAVGAGVDVDAADHDAVGDAGIAVAAILHRHARHRPQRLDGVVDVGTLERFTRHRRDVERNLLHRLVAAGRRDDDFLERGSRLRDGRRHGALQACGSHCHRDQSPAWTRTMQASPHLDRQHVAPGLNFVAHDLTPVSAKRSGWIAVLVWKIDEPSFGP